METVQIRANYPDPLEFLRQCGGYYECPKDENGKRLGPLVGYTGRDEYDRQYVGDIYVNFAKAERHAPVFDRLAKLLWSSFAKDWVDVPDYITGFCGAPEGGKALAQKLASLEGVQYIYPEKKIIKLASESSREETELLFTRNQPYVGDCFWIVEDVVHNFSTTRALIKLINSFGARVDGIICLLNGSLTVEDRYQHLGNKTLPVFSLIRKPIPEYMQDDFSVFDDVKADNVVWNPKKDWWRLEEAMRAAS